MQKGRRWIENEGLDVDSFGPSYGEMVQIVITWNDGGDEARKLLLERKTDEVYSKCAASYFGDVEFIYLQQKLPTGREREREFELLNECLMGAGIEIERLTDVKLYQAIASSLSEANPMRDRCLERYALVLVPVAEPGDG